MVASSQRDYESVKSMKTVSAANVQSQHGGDDGIKRANKISIRQDRIHDFNLYQKSMYVMICKSLEKNFVVIDQSILDSSPDQIKDKF